MLPALDRYSGPAPLTSRVLGATAEVDRSTYAATGFGLAGLKYLSEVGAIYALTGNFFDPLSFLSPLMTIRLDVMAGVDGIWLVLLALWNLLFAWIGVSMSVRRARNAGISPFWGLLFFAPLINFLLMIVLALLPTRTTSRLSLPLQGSDRLMWSALMGVAGGSAIGLVMVLLSVFVVGEYGGALFMGTPLVIGTVSGFLLNLRQPQPTLPNVIVGVLSVLISGGLLLVFALEGAICLAMAAPICMVLSVLGVLLGRELARVEGRGAVLGAQVLLPALMFLEPPPTQDRMVETVIEIQAPPEAVWEAVVGFGGVELAPPPEWFFHLGIAYPIRARIEGLETGVGVGAVRYCEFSTGPFVEPITVWDPPRHLAFDVRESPPTMHEWSPYARVHAPHLDGILVSKHGEFLLEPLPDGGTRLTGHTWYRFDMAPEPYWGMWSDASIHAIHTRVLKHIKQVAEQG